MSTLPSLAEIQACHSEPDSPLARALSLLFEPSPILLTTLEPQLSNVIASSPPLTSYDQLIDLALTEIDKWDIPARSEFISGHPRIGESKALSTLSAKEQGAQGVKPTPPEVLARLNHLNACYETCYPGLRYITFVNGRSRAVIAEEMEDVLGYSHSLSPDEPAIETLTPLEIGTTSWLSELNRAVQDVGRIAKSRIHRDQRSTFINNHYRYDVRRSEVGRGRLF